MKALALVAAERPDVHRDGVCGSVMDGGGARPAVSGDEWWDWRVRGAGEFGSSLFLRQARGGPFGKLRGRRTSRRGESGGENRSRPECPAYRPRAASPGLGVAFDREV